MSNRVLTLGAEFRSLNEEKRQASFVASTENAVQTWNGPEVLRMKGARLQRFRRNPVVLDTHNRFDLGSVIGKAEVSVQGRELHTTITYASTERGELAWSLVRDGFVRAVSIGYSINPKRVLRLREGETDGTGEALVKGPASVVNEWELLEVSNVPVPADADAVRRSFYESLPESNDSPAVGESESTPVNEREAPMSAITQAMSGAISPTPAPAQGAAPAPEQPAAPARATVTPISEISEEVRARKAEAFKREVLAITPRGLEGVAEAAILDGKSLEEVRAELKKAQAARFAPVGTPEPAPAATGQPKHSTPELSDDDFVRAFKRSTLSGSY